MIRATWLCWCRPRACPARLDFSSGVAASFFHFHSWIFRLMRNSFGHRPEKNADRNLRLCRRPTRARPSGIPRRGSVALEPNSGGGFRGHDCACRPIRCVAHAPPSGCVKSSRHRFAGCLSSPIRSGGARQRRGDSLGSRKFADHSCIEGEFGGCGARPTAGDRNTRSGKSSDLMATRTIGSSAGRLEIQLQVVDPSGKTFMDSITMMSSRSTAAAPPANPLQAPANLPSGQVSSDQEEIQSPLVAKIEPDGAVGPTLGRSSAISGRTNAGTSTAETGRSYSGSLKSKPRFELEDGRAQ